MTHPALSKPVMQLRTFEGEPFLKCEPRYLRGISTLPIEGWFRPKACGVISYCHRKDQRPILRSQRNEERTWCALTVKPSSPASRPREVMIGYGDWALANEGWF